MHTMFGKLSNYVELMYNIAQLHFSVAIINISYCKFRDTEKT